MAWKTLSLKIVILYFCVSLAYGKEAIPADFEAFAEKIRQTILNRDIKTYYDLHSEMFFRAEGKSDNLGVILEKDYRNYIFGNDKFSIRPFLSKKKYAYYIRYDDEKNAYSLIFYDPEMVIFPNNYSDESLWKCWLRCYIQTFIYYIDGKWQLKEASFYYGLIIPGSGEYG